MTERQHDRQAATGQKTRVGGFRQSLAYQALLLGGFATVAGVLLVVGNGLTADAIVQRQAEDLQASLGEVVPAAIHDNDLLAAELSLTGPDGKTITAYRATRDGSAVAVAYPVTGLGYSGEIALLMGVDADGRVLGVRVLSHSETPGLGDKIEAAKSDWIRGFDGRSLGAPPPQEWRVRGDGGEFDGLTGATITARAVIEAVREGLAFFAAERAVLLKGSAGETSQSDDE
jgi:Na+-translocating ferredoxin:NAD+ oxidoreductase subunit G